MTQLPEINGKQTKTTDAEGNVSSPIRVKYDGSILRPMLYNVASDSSKRASENTNLIHRSEYHFVYSIYSLRASNDKSILEYTKL